MFLYCSRIAPALPFLLRFCPARSVSAPARSVSAQLCSFVLRLCPARFANLIPHVPLCRFQFKDFGLGPPGDFRASFPLDVWDLAADMAAHSKAASKASQAKAHLFNFKQSKMGNVPKQHIRTKWEAFPSNIYRHARNRTYQKGKRS